MVKLFIMKIWIFYFLFLISINNLFSQVVLEKRYQLLVEPFVEAVVNNDRKKITELIYYPLRRQYPIPPIHNKEEMIERYDQVFDEKLINIIKNSSVETDWQAIGWHGIGFMDGLILIDYDDGKICSINYQSLQEKGIRKNIILEIKNNLHESLREFKEPCLLCETETYILRIDLLDNDNFNYIYRLVLWTKGKNQKESPDMVLINGEITFSGSGENHYYIFEHNNYQYILYIDVMSEKYGYFMIYRGIDKDWYDIPNRENIILEENINKIEN
jgi:hypothetical protein